MIIIKNHDIKCGLEKKCKTALLDMSYLKMLGGSCFAGDPVYTF